jgi:hypothetical protein
MFVAFETRNGFRSRYDGAPQFTTAQEVADYYNANGGFAEVDEEHNAVDVFTRGGIVLTFEEVEG